MASPMPSMANALTATRPDQGPGRFGPTPAPPPAGNMLMPLQGAPPPAANALVSPRPGPMAPGVQNPQPMPEAFPRSPEGMEHRVSTRIPTSKKLIIDPHTRNDISAGYHAMLPQGFATTHYDVKHHGEAMRGIDEGMKKNAQLIRDEYPHVNTDGLTDAGVLERFIEHAHDNTVGLWNKVRGEGWAPLAAQWYKGANRIAKQMAADHNVSPRQAAAVIATLSPRKDWDQNVDIAQRVLHAHANHQDTAITPEMRSMIDQYVAARTPEKAVDLAAAANGVANPADGSMPTPGMAVGMKLRDLQHPLQKALFARAWDEAHGPGKGYDIISPGGERTRAMVGVEGSKRNPLREAPTTWSGFDNVARAFQALESDHLPTISRALGSMHKVRNFYNNIIAPDAAAFLPMQHHDATVDTHQINVGNMLPMGGGHKLVSHGLGSAGSSPNVTGSKGLYPLHLESLRRAAQTISQAEGRRYLPREVQSVVWEAIRSLFPEHVKGYDAGGNPTHALGQAARDAGFAVKHGFMPHGMALDALVRHATGGGIREGRVPPPNWWRG